MPNKFICLLLAFGLLTMPLVGTASSSRDHDRARAALQAGQILPLGSILKKLEKQFPGDVLEVELDQEHSRWIYELKILQRNGALLKLEVDARNGDVIKQKGEIQQQGEKR